MIAISIILIAVFGLLCALVVHDCNRSAERQRMNEWSRLLHRLWIPQEVEHRYWRYRHPHGHWPGKEN